MPQAPQQQWQSGPIGGPAPSGPLPPQGYQAPMPPQGYYQPVVVVQQQQTAQYGASHHSRSYPRPLWHLRHWLDGLWIYLTRHFVADWRDHCWCGLWLATIFLAFFTFGVSFVCPGIFNLVVLITSTSFLPVYSSSVDGVVR